MHPFRDEKPPTDALETRAAAARRRVGSAVRSWWRRELDTVRARRGRMTPAQRVLPVAFAAFVLLALPLGGVHAARIVAAFCGIALVVAIVANV